MSHYLFFNGRFLNNDKPLVVADNRGLRYGDGVFETMKVNKGAVMLANYHWQRLFSGLQALQFQCPSYFTADYLQKAVQQLCEKNAHSIARVRLSVIRGNGGLYNPENHTPNCIIQSWALPETSSLLNGNGLVVGIYRQAQKAMDGFANFKTNNYLAYAMAALFAKQQRWNDAFLLNSACRVCDATIANIFIVKNNILYTPALNEGAVAGVMRRFILDELPNAGFEVQETSIAEEELYNADEVFLTNALYTLKWVQQCEVKSYSNKLSTEIYYTLKKKLNN